MSKNKLILLVALGAVVTAFPLLVAIGGAGLALYQVSAGVTYTIVSDPSYPSVRHASTYDRSTLIQEEWREIQRGDGSWIKDGPSVRWSRKHEKLEEGSYRDGRREGKWTFWSEDRSIDLARSGIYENDVLIQAGATPLGDYWHDLGEVGDR
jgi:hypothetical protein